jgi:hypothetical protein
LLLVQLGDLRAQCGGVRVAAGFGVGVGGGKLGGEQRLAALGEYPVVQEAAADGVEQWFGAWTVRG